MSRVYNQISAPVTVSTSRTSNTPRQLDFMTSESDSIFLATLARSNFSISSSPTTPTTQSTFGSSAMSSVPSHATVPRQSVYSLFTNPEEPPYRVAPVWPTGFSYEEDNEFQPLNTYAAAATPSRTSSSGSYPRGQAVEVHHGTARVTAWVKKAFKKVTPKGWRRLEDDASKGRMTLD
ncbi:hypothetical protein FS837_012936 [Tulasnella sp. UAMH 9824]|nr:hypothetical protein FS837_012936 [Tulasnella sp. UAMH 9824]